jgi:hypothetical protein
MIRALKASAKSLKLEGQKARKIGFKTAFKVTYQHLKPAFIALKHYFWLV